MKWGEKILNILTLGIVYKGMAITIYWLVFNKQGNSNQRISYLIRMKENQLMTDQRGN